MDWSLDMTIHRLDTNKLLHAESMTDDSRCMHSSPKMTVHGHDNFNITHAGSMIGV